MSTAKSRLGAMNEAIKSLDSSRTRTTEDAQYSNDLVAWRINMRHISAQSAASIIRIQRNRKRK